MLINSKHSSTLIPILNTYFSTLTRLDTHSLRIESNRFAWCKRSLIPTHSFTLIPLVLPQRRSGPQPGEPGWSDGRQDLYRYRCWWRRHARWRLPGGSHVPAGRKAHWYESAGTTGVAISFFFLSLSFLPFIFSLSVSSSSSSFLFVSM